MFNNVQLNVKELFFCKNRNFVNFNLIAWPWKLLFGNFLVVYVKHAAYIINSSNYVQLKHSHLSGLNIKSWYTSDMSTCGIWHSNLFIVFWRIIMKCLASAARSAITFLVMICSIKQNPIICNMCPSKRPCYKLT